MSELINARDNRATIRWKLLTGVSALALTSYISTVGAAKAEDVGHPLLWLELGGQFDFLDASTELWRPSNAPPPIDHDVFASSGRMPRIGYDIDGKITFQPAGSGWSLSAAIRYGKAKRGPNREHDQTYETHLTSYDGAKYAPTTYAFTDLKSVEESKHVVLDFQAGKDVGLGLFGHHGTSTVNLGVRVAQFREKADSNMSAIISMSSKYFLGPNLNAYMHSTRSFSGIGPSIAWNGSVPLAGSLEDGFAFDWGANAALLFGRQRTKAQTHTERNEYSGYTYSYTASGGLIYNYNFAQVTHSTRASVRKKNVTVPNVGGFAGISYRLHGDAKISFGYRADYFFGAIDGGIDAAKKENRGFYGPFASISIGIGN